MDFWIWCSLIFGSLSQICVATGIIELRLVHYDVPSGRTGSGAEMCCDYNGNMGKQPTCPSNECDPYLYICIQDVVHLGGCPMGESVTGFTANNDHVTFTDTVGHNHTANPIIFHFNGGYGGVLIPKITAYDEDRSSGAALDEKIDYLQHVISRAPDYNNSRQHVVPVTMKGKVSTLNLEVNVRCDADYYGDDCQRYCVPDTESYCNATGQLVCRPGAPCDPNRPMTPITTPSTAKPTTTATTTTTKTTSTEPSTTHTVAPFPDFRFPTAGTPSPAPVASTTSQTPGKSSTPSASMPTATSVSHRPNITSQMAESSTTKTTTLIPTHACYLSQSPESHGDIVQISIPGGSDVDVLTSHVTSRLASALNVDTKRLQINVTFITNATGESIYDLFAFNAVTHQVINNTTLRHVVMDLCRNVFSALTADKTSPDDESNTATIAGVVSGVVLLGALTPALAFLYRRKCKRSKVADEDTERTLN